MQALQQLRQVKDGEVDSLSAQQEAEILAVLKRQKVQLGEQSGPSCSAQPSLSGVSGAAISAFNFLMSPEFNIDGIVNKALPSSDRMEGGDSYEDNEEVQGPFFQQHQSKPPRPPISHTLHTPSQGQHPSAPIKYDWNFYFKQCKPDDKDPVRRSSHFLHQLIRLIVLNTVETEYAPEKYMLRKLLSRLSFMGKLEPPEQRKESRIKHLGVTDFYQALEEVGEDLNRLLRDGFEGLGAPPFAWLRGLHVEDVHSRMQAIQSEKNKYDQPKLLMDTAAAAYSSGARQMQNHLTPSPPN
ncbi:hypothetical protein CEUSTIGMA_g13337.t1 [Chlamydomonas eustigma]|uniref:Uncharacterized protein n=1 Tax=Chlamydomonas eustigma TaxID=1157962 RepID=A0A250XS55_9CHLO|nr:hypothetical protein CEUSTIGMA_g13337.t1 [Chlamydomonas eustigma]|eukprot:GAX85921.1 hypothetical protein CEUSTIGMA_g13337.t1 [Chlamydomonas eustigma]